jgi:hypothetical protein
VSRDWRGAWYQAQRQRMTEAYRLERYAVALALSLIVNAGLGIAIAVMVLSR